MTALIIALCLFLLVFLSIYQLYRGIFCYPLKKRRDVYHIPDSNLYRTHRDKMLETIEDMERTACEEVSVCSADNLRLYGKFYPMGEDAKKDAPLIIFFHGYHGTYAWDGYGFFRLCKKNGINLLMVDERTHGKSEGDAVTFGIKERYDCKLWAEYAEKRFGKNTDIFLAGVSMGAASVMMSFELGLPKTVKGIIADCGYHEPAAIIKETVRGMRLPVKPFYWLIRFGARIFGHFDLEEASPIQSIRKLNIPLLLIHGTKDCVVPLSMGEALYAACPAKKECLFVEGADHANSAMTDYTAYESVVLRFVEQEIMSK